MTRKSLVLQAIAGECPPRVPILYCNRDFEHSDVLTTGFAAAAGFDPVPRGLTEWGDRVLDIGIGGDGRTGVEVAFVEDVDPPPGELLVTRHGPFRPPPRSPTHRGSAVRPSLGGRTGGVPACAHPDLRVMTTCGMDVRQNAHPSHYPQSPRRAIVRNRGPPAMEANAAASGGQPGASERSARLGLALVLVGAAVSAAILIAGVLPTLTTGPTAVSIFTL